MSAPLQSAQTETVVSGAEIPVEAQEQEGDGDLLGPAGPAERVQGCELLVKAG